MAPRRQKALPDPKEVLPKNREVRNAAGIWGGLYIYRAVGRGDEQLAVYVYVAGGPMARLVLL